MDLEVMVSAMGTTVVFEDMASTVDGEVGGGKEYPEKKNPPREEG
jgi:hypothetical protein